MHIQNRGVGFQFSSLFLFFAFGLIEFNEGGCHKVNWLILYVPWLRVCCLSSIMTDLC